MARTETRLPTHWLLDGRTGWRDILAVDVSIGGAVLTLEPTPAGPLSLAAANGTLGGLVLPPWLALDADGTAYLLSPDGQELKRFEPPTGGFVAVPTLGGRGTGARQFLEARKIAVHGDDLYVVDAAAARVQVLTVKGLATRAVWGPFAAPGAPLRSRYSTGRFVTPGDVEPRDADRVLDFLNRARTAREIADAIEFPKERDIGVRVARRILDRRGAIGRFTSLEQVDAVPQVGPERFTEIVVTLTGVPVRWRPVDIAFAGKVAYVLDDATPAIWEVPVPGGRARAAVRVRDGLPEPPGRIVAGASGELYVSDPARDVLREFRKDKWGSWHATVGAGGEYAEYSSPGQLAGRIAEPALRVDSSGRFCLARELTAECCRRAPPAAPPDDPLAARRDGGLLFDRNGSSVAELDEDVPPERLYATGGTATLGPLDSGIYRCQWDRVVMRIASLPGGSSIAVHTYTDDTLRSPAEVASLPGSWWSSSGVVTAPPQAPARPLTPGRSRASGRGTVTPANPSGTTDTDMLVQSRQGQYLWLRVGLAGDGYSTPRLGAVRAHYPRESYLTHLPAVYQSDTESAWFLQRFLGIAKASWDGVGEEITDAPRLFDPDATPDRRSLDWLAAWFGLTFSPEATPQARRRLLKTALRIYGHRGTPASLREWLKAHVANLSGIEPEEQRGYPFVLESFRLRKWLFLNEETVARLGWGGTLWGPGVVGRLQLEKYSRIGDVRLLDTGHADTDVAREYSDRFSVFVPAALAPTRSEAETLRRAIAQEKPAHAHAALHLVEPRFRVGVQATIGMDTIIGPYPALRLASWDDPPDLEFRPPSSVLGSDSVLSQAPGDRRAPSLLLGRSAFEFGLSLD